MRKIVIRNINSLVRHLDEFYRMTEGIENNFGGPSIYFHLESIKESQRRFLSKRHIEMIYATLASWGMHRMGSPDKTKTKLTTFDQFKDSILSFRNEFNSLRNLYLRTISDNRLEMILQEELKNIFYGLKISISDSYLVANSKTMHHIIPNLVPPIDRQYTLRFFYYKNSEFFQNNKYRTIQLPSTLEAQYGYFCEILRYSKRIISNDYFNHYRLINTSFDTSIPKVLDNLIMAYVKSKRRK